MKRGNTETGKSKKGSLYMGDKNKDKRDEYSITIYLKNIKLKSGQTQKMFDEDFIKAVEKEYAVRYLEQIGVNGTQNNIDMFLEKTPISSCEIVPGQNNPATGIPESITIYPNRKQNSFDYNSDRIMEQKRAQQQKDNQQANSGQRDSYSTQQDINALSKTKFQEKDDELNPMKNVQQFQKEIEDVGVFFKKLNSLDKNQILEKQPLGGAQIDQKQIQDINVEQVDWIKKFLYPFSLDTAPLRPIDFPVHGVSNSVLAQEPAMQKPRPGDKFDILNTNILNFPLTHLDYKDEFLEDILKPITIQKDEILKDIYQYRKEFPYQIIPHITDNGEINDIIHNYKKQKPKKEDVTKMTGIDDQNKQNNKNALRKSPVKKNENVGFSLFKKDPKQNLALVGAKPSLTDKDIELAKDEITNESTAKLIGLICHLTYWRVFGHLNPLPLDHYHLKQLFISITQIQQGYESKFSGKRVFVNFVMPMIVLAVRIVVERIFKQVYKIFFSKPQHEKIAIKLINDVITRVLDPNIYYSRMSFFESGRQAINIKYEKSKRTHNSQNKFFTRSALVQQLIPNPSEGKVRALFGTGKITTRLINSVQAEQNQNDNEQTNASSVLSLNNNKIKKIDKNGFKMASNESTNRVQEIKSYKQNYQSDYDEYASETIPKESVFHPNHGNLQNNIFFRIQMANQKYEEQQKLQMISELQANKDEDQMSEGNRIHLDFSKKQNIAENQQLQNNLQSKLIVVQDYFKAQNGGQQINLSNHSNIRGSIKDQKDLNPQKLRTFSQGVQNINDKSSIDEKLAYKRQPFEKYGFRKLTYYSNFNNEDQVLQTALSQDLKKLQTKNKFNLTSMNTQNETQVRQKTAWADQQMPYSDAVSIQAGHGKYRQLNTIMNLDQRQNQQMNRSINDFNKDALNVPMSTKIGNQVSNQYSGLAPIIGKPHQRLFSMDGKRTNAGKRVAKKNSEIASMMMEEKDDMLDLVNKVQMFRIATKKINHNLEVKGKAPVFKLSSNNSSTKIDKQI